MTAETTAGAEAYFRLEELGIPAQPEPFCEQISEEEFFLYACRQAQQLQNGCRQLQGPHYGEINAVLSDVDRELKAIHPHLTPEHLMSVYYQSAEAKAQYKWINRAHYVEWKVEDLRRDRTKRLRALGGQWAESDEIRLPAGLLNEPIYSPQYDVMKCFNACFRMVFQGVTNHLPTENSVAKGMRHEVVHDEEFLNIFNTQQFKQSFPEKSVQVLTISGAAVATLGNIALKMKSKRPEAEVFCIVGLESSSNRDMDIWHSAVLLEAEPDQVWLHDPARQQRLTRVSNEQFYKRWAVAHNRAHLIIAA